MIKQKQDEFYKLVGRALQVARQQRRMSIADLVNASGEQHKTIKGIESGTAQVSLHHAVWMKNILGLDLNAIIRDMEGNNGKEINNGSGTHSTTNETRNGLSESGLTLGPKPSSPGNQSGFSFKDFI